MPQTITPTLAEPTRDIYAGSVFYRWLALAAALLAWGFDGVEQGVYSVMTRQALKDLVPLADGLAVRDMDSTIGWYFSLSMAMWLWGAAVGGVLFGRIGDRYGRARGLIFSVTTYALFTGLSALTTHWSGFLACRFFGAIGLGGTWPLCVALVVETWPEKYRARLAGAIGAAANVGYLLAASYSRVMLHYHFTWRGIIGMGCLIGLLSLPVIFFVPEPEKWRATRQQRQRSSLAELFTPAYRRSTIVGSLLSTVALLGTWGSFLWFATYIDQISEGTTYAGTAKATVSQWQSLGQIAGGFLGGLIAGWLGNKRSYLLLCIGAWASVFMLFYLTVEYDVQVIFLAILAGIFVTSFFGWLPKYLPELYPTRIRATGQGFAYNIGRVLSGFGVLGAGSLVALFNGDYRQGMMAMSFIYLFGLAVIIFAPDTGGRMREESTPA